MSKKTGKKAQWETAVAKAQLVCAELKQKRDELQQQMEKELWPALEELKNAQSEYEEWQGNLPESLASSPTAEKLEAVTSIEIDEEPSLDDLDEVETTLDDAHDVDLPQGFGRD